MSLTAHFKKLDELLLSYRHCWQRPLFSERDYPWRQSHPQLAEQLDTLDDDAASRLAESPDAARQRLAPWLEPGLAETLAGLCRIPEAPARLLRLPPRLGEGIPGRKWQQIQAFAAAFTPLPGPIIDWCSGKGYLGRALSLASGQPVVGLEWDPGLCAAGNAWSVRHDSPLRLVHEDVLGASVVDQLSGQTQVVALHACGDLHQRLLELTVEVQLENLSLSPCCYHRTVVERYRPLSRPGRDSLLLLSRADLALAVQETVTTGQRGRRLRDTEAAWRLGFDNLQRALRGVDEYLPVPTLPKSVLGGDFVSFCHWAAEARGIPGLSSLALRHYEAQGWLRLKQVRRMELVSHLFRRPLELWLVLDRACYLEERGYRVRVEQFCSRDLTPRNLVMQARREA